MKRNLIQVALVLVTCNALSFGQTQVRSAEIDAQIKKTGRYALLDMNRDGWDDIWQSLFQKVDFTKPSLDSDGDGKSNYEEMLDMQDPFRPNKPARMLTAAQITSARKSQKVNRHATDLEKRTRFLKLLKSKEMIGNPVELLIPQPDSETPILKPAGQEDHKQSSSTNDSVAPEFLLLHPEMLLCLPPGQVGPSIIGMERLSNGQILLAWEGRPDRLNTIEYSNDLIHWREAAVNLPTLNGIGSWGQISSSPKRFFRILEEDLPTLPSATDGGNGETTYGATVSINDPYPTVWYTVDVTVNLPAGAEPSEVTLFVDGMEGDSCEMISTGQYRGRIIKHFLLPGVHTVHAVATAMSETVETYDQPNAVSGAVVRSPEMAFNVVQNSPEGSLALGFMATEPEIDAQNPELPAETHFVADIPVGAYSWFLHLIDSDGNQVREWSGTIPPGESEYLDIPWDGKASNGSMLPSDTYAARLTLGGATDWGPSEWITVRANPPIWKALSVSEPLAHLSGDWDYASFRPPWAEEFEKTSGRGWDTQNDDFPPATGIQNSWGPWGKLWSCKNISKGLQASLGRAGKWGVQKWNSGLGGNDSEIDPLAVFESGGNPFNGYELGLFTGHGVACEGGVYASDYGPALLKAQHFMPIVKNHETGEAHWVCNAEIPKYGAEGSRLKWMFLMTCCSFSEYSPYSIFQTMKNSGTLPFGPGLHVLCGYVQKIDLEQSMGDLLARSLKGEIGDSNKVVSAWDTVWSKTINSKDRDYDGNPKPIRIARSVYWPECRNDTIFGVRDANITEPSGDYDFARLKIKDIPETP